MCARFFPVIKGLAPFLVAALSLGGPVWATCAPGRIYEQLSDTDMAALAAELAATPFATGTLFTATKGDEVLTLAGTLHLPDPRMDAMVKALEPALAGAGLLMLESTMEDMRAMQADAGLTPDRYFLMGQKTLMGLLAPPDQARLKAALQARGMPLMAVQKVQPWMAAMTLSLPPCLTQSLAPGQIPQGLDLRLMAAAGAAGLPMAALEDWRATIDLMARAPMDEQIAQLSMTLATEARSDAIFVTMLEGYFEGEVWKAWLGTKAWLRAQDDLDQALIEKGVEEMERDLMIHRNTAWIGAIEAAAAAQDKPIVLAFGALHLPGKDGVLNLLAQRGWTIAPLPVK